MKSPKRCAIILRLDPEVIDRIDTVRHTLKMNRTDWIRKAIHRNIRYNMQHELPLVEREDIQACLLYTSRCV